MSNVLSSKSDKHNISKLKFSSQFKCPYCISGPCCRLDL